MHKHHPIRRGAALLRLSGIVVRGDKLQAIVAAISSNDRINNKRNYGYTCGRNAAIDAARHARALERARKLQTELYAEYTQRETQLQRAHAAIEQAIHSMLMRVEKGNHSATRIAGMRTQLAILRVVTLEGGTYQTRSLRYRDMSRDLWDQNRRRGALLILQDLPPEAVPYLTLWRGRKSVLERQAEKLDRLQKRLTV